MRSCNLVRFMQLRSTDLHLLLCDTAKLIRIQRALNNTKTRVGADKIDTPVLCTHRRISSDQENVLDRVAQPTSAFSILVVTRGPASVDDVCHTSSSTVSKTGRYHLETQRGGKGNRLYRGAAEAERRTIVVNYTMTSSMMISNAHARCVGNE